MEDMIISRECNVLQKIINDLNTCVPDERRRIVTWLNDKYRASTNYGENE